MRFLPSVPNDDDRQIPVSEIPDDVSDNIRQALRGLQFGEITIQVRNGEVTQIERVARKRQFKSRKVE